MSKTTLETPKTGEMRQRRPPFIHSYSPFGSATAMQRDALGFLRRARHYGDVVGMRFVIWPTYMVFHPDDVRHVLQENHRNYNKDFYTYKLLGQFLGQGLLTNDGSSWLHQRRLIQPAFHRKRLTTYSMAMTEAASSLVERWHAVAQDQPLDIAEEMMHITQRIVGQVLFNIDLSNETGTVGQAVTVLNALVSDYLYSPLPPLSVPTTRNRRIRAASHTIDAVVYRIISERRQQATDTGDLLSMLLAARDEETGEGMNDQQVRDEVITLLLAGHETTATTLSWTWYLLSQSPDVEQRLYAELDEVLAGQPPTVEHLPALPYTHMIIDEALRLYPTVWIISRKALADDELGGYHIPAGTFVSLSPYVTHRHPAFWENPEVFDPERFTPQRAAGRLPYAYYPFAGGPRLCIGNTFALMEAQLILATIAQRYQLRLVPGQLIEPKPMITLRPRNGLLMTLHPRT